MAAFSELPMVSGALPGNLVISDRWLAVALRGEGFTGAAAASLLEQPGSEGADADTDHTADRGVAWKVHAEVDP